MPRRMRDSSNTPSTSLPRECSLPRKEPSSRRCTPALPPTTVWGARGWPFPHRRPRKRVDLKWPDRLSVSAPPSRPWPSGQDEESILRNLGRQGQTVQTFLPASNTLSSLRSVTPTHRGLVCRKSPSTSASFSVAFGRRTRLSPSSTRSFVASGLRDRRHSRFSSTAYCSWPRFSPVLRSPSSWTRTPTALLRGGGRRFLQTFSTPQHRYVFHITTPRFLYRISFTNGSVYQGYRFGLSAQFGPATHFSLAETRLASTGFT